MKIEFLYFEGCSSYEEAFRNLLQALKELDQPAEIVRIRIKGQGEAIYRRFIGSPTIRVNGLDIDKSARSVTTYGLQCRTYEIDGKLTGVPTKEYIKEALQEIREQSSEK